MAAARSEREASILKLNRGRVAAAEVAVQGCKVEGPRKVEGGGLALRTSEYDTHAQVSLEINILIKFFV